MSFTFAHTQDQKPFIYCSFLVKKEAPRIVVLTKSNMSAVTILGNNHTPFLPSSQQAYHYQSTWCQCV